MPKWTEHDLEVQWKRVINLGWLEYFKQTAIESNFPTEILIAIGSRETNLDPKYQKQTGDGGHGHSIMQIDDRSYPEFCQSGAWKNIELAIKQGALVLEEKLKVIKTAKGIPESDHLRLSIAAYNCGANGVITAFKSGNGIDSRTTGKDYSADVLKRAEFFKKKLEG